MFLEGIRDSDQPQVGDHLDPILTTVIIIALKSSGKRLLLILWSQGAYTKKVSTRQQYDQDSQNKLDSLKTVLNR